MRLYRLESETWVPRGIDEVFAFHADAANLQAITPAFLDFRIVTPPPIEMKVGARIEYRIRLRGFPMRWLTEITAWEPTKRFVDEQLKGPYRLWLHEHTFETREGGTLIRDRVRYAVPFGRLVHGWAVAPDVRRIFTFRHEALLGLFGGSVSGQPARVTISMERNPH
jgi:ligand-binding SRPBCC domain-containing protein